MEERLPLPSSHRQETGFPCDWSVNCTSKGEHPFGGLALNAACSWAFACADAARSSKDMIPHRRGRLIGITRSYMCIKSTGIPGILDCTMPTVAQGDKHSRDGSKTGMLCKRISV